MGAFFLFQPNSQDLNLQKVEQVFAKKGFAAPEIFDLGSMTLWLYRKQLVDELNYVLHEDGAALYATGTVIYKGLSYRATLRALLQDFRQGRLDLDALLGNFSLLFHVEGKIRILTDRLCAHHLFMDEGTTRLSTSFLASLASFKKPQPLNRMAFYEKIATGHIVGPDTLVSSIRQITPQMQRVNNCGPFIFLNHPPDTNSVVQCKQDFDACVEQQLDTLSDYFTQINPLALEYGVDLGLSGGYDSRLLLLLARHCHIPLSLHTHLTEGVRAHNCQKSIAQEIARAVGLNLRIIETKHLMYHGELERRSILQDNLYYYDARSTNNVGSFSETHTRRYKVATMGVCRLGLNGKGGEIYRNYYFTSRRCVQFMPWWENHVVYPFAEAAFGSAPIYKDLGSYVRDKMELRLGAQLKGRVSFLTLRRYYGEIKAAECDAKINDAYNQLAFHLTPFIEHRVLTAGYAATPHIGLSGRFEAAMLSHLDGIVAGITSHYGFPLTKEPLRHKAYATISGYIPDAFWLFRNRLRLRYRDLGRANLVSYAQMRDDSLIIQEIEATLCSAFPEINWLVLMRDKTSQANALYLGLFLREFDSCLR